MRFLLVLLLAAPVVAQSSPENSAVQFPVETEGDAPVQEIVDPMLVGDWTLDEVTAGGILAQFGVNVQAMTATFSAAGQAEIVMTAVQDGETLFRERAFSFTTNEGRILEENEDPVDYAILEDGSLVLTDDEMVIRFVRAGP